MVKGLGSLVTKTYATIWHDWLHLKRESSQTRQRSAVLKIDYRAFIVFSAEIEYENHAGCIQLQ